ncbi:MAG: hypothetical protein NUW00_02595 [Candidatus Kaiserbacteria bacterium]|nr:hypothetical protein [Candidatus Kaiserbacteria bacterium]
MKPSDFWKLLHLTQLFEVVGAIFRVVGGARAPENAEDKIFKHVFGIFGTGDEKVLCVRLEGLKITTDKSYVDDIIGYLKYAFPRGTTGQRIESWRSGNSFRKFVTENDDEAAAVGFLKWMVETIREKKSKTAGHRHLEEQMRLLGIPGHNSMIADLIDKVHFNPAVIKQTIETDTTETQQRVDTLRRSRGFLERLI